MSNNLVEITALERDDRIDEIQNNFAQALQAESGYTKLSAEQQSKIQTVLDQLKAMRFDSADNFQTIAESLLAPIAPDLTPYIGIALQNARNALPDTPGVLVIYTGGTIGSAPKDPADPDSPQVVKSWKELKSAAPKLGALGYPVDAISFVEPLDSCNVGPAHWGTIAYIVRDHYADYAGFVILHGTDTMPYTASALGFMLQELNKPVVATASQVGGIVNPRNDAHQNMVTAIMLANPLANNLPIIPEVFIAFGNRVIRGVRAKKMDVISFQGFDSPNLPLLGDCGDSIKINRALIRQPSGLPLEVYDQMDTHVITLEMFPGIQDAGVLGSILDNKELKGVVVKAYGAGNIPTQSDFLDLFSTFVKRGGIVVVVTGVPAGEVEMGLYETSQVLLDRDLIGGFDLTAEAALCKLMVLLGTYPNEPETVKQLMQQSLVGEQRLNLMTTKYAGAGQVAAGNAATLSPTPLDSVEDIDRIERVMLRLKQACLDTAGEESANLSLALHDGSDLGSYKREAVGAFVQDDAIGESLAIDLTKYRDHFVSRDSGSKMGNKLKLGFKIAVEGAEDACLSWQDAELNIYVQDQG